MLKLSPYSVFEFLEELDMVVNTINTKGYMGKGLAKEFATRFPEMEKEYIKKCAKKEIKAGSLWVWQGKRNLVGNIATKDDYKFLSKIEWISNGLRELKKYIEDNKIKSVSIPKLGSSLGGLDWRLVEEKIIECFEESSANIVIAMDIKSGPKENLALEKLFKAVEECGETKAPLLSGNPSGDCREFSKNIQKLLRNIKENKRKIKRFRDIKRIKGIGNIAYRELLKAFWE